MDLGNLEERMNKTLSVLEENFSEVRAGRGNPGILNKISVAIKNAKMLEKYHLNNNKAVKYIEANPSTMIYKIVEELEK